MYSLPRCFQPITLFYATFLYSMRFRWHSKATHSKHLYLATPESWWISSRSEIFILSYTMRNETLQILSVHFYYTIIFKSTRGWVSKYTIRDDSRWGSLISSNIDILFSPFPTAVSFNYSTLKAESLDYIWRFQIELTVRKSWVFYRLVSVDKKITILQNVFYHHTHLLKYKKAAT